MLDTIYLEKGITGLARAVDHNWTQGHFGCALIATWNLCATDALPAGAEAALQRELDALIASRAHLFEPFAPAEAQPEMVAEIAAPIEGRLDKLRHGGHDAIYSAFALDGLATRPDLATPEIVGGIVRLLEGVLDLGPEGDFWGVPVEEESLGPVAANETELVENALCMALEFDPMYNELQGNVGHVLTHTHALVMLTRLGYAEIARPGWEAARRHAARIRLLHTHFDKSYWTRRVPPAGDPLAPEFWEAERDHLPDSSWGYGHFFKFRYQFYDLLHYVSDEALRERAIAQMPLLIMNGFESQGRSPKEFMVARPPKGIDR